MPSECVQYLDADGGSDNLSPLSCAKRHEGKHAPQNRHTMSTSSESCSCWSTASSDPPTDVPAFATGALTSPPELVGPDPLRLVVAADDADADADADDDKNGRVFTGGGDDADAADSAAADAPITGLEDGMTVVPGLVRSHSSISIKSCSTNHLIARVIATSARSGYCAAKSVCPNQA
jgi:hypothetical protein